MPALITGYPAQSKSKGFEEVDLLLVDRHLVGYQLLLEQGVDLVGHEVSVELLKRKFMSCSHCQDLGQPAALATDWLFTLVQPIRSQLAC